jgi:hypothetical protein
MKNLIICVVLGAILFTVLLFSCGCTKEYIEKPSCFKYAMLSDKFSGELIYEHTDTIWSSGIHGTFSYCCDKDTMMFNQKPDTIGCENGYQCFRYVKI